MGTRNLTCVYYKKEYKVAQYCQWDGYPSGQGLGILNFLKQKGNLLKLKRNLNKCKFLTEKQIQKFWKECGADGSGFVNMEVSDQFKRMYRSLHRDCGGDDILEFIAKTKTEVDLGNHLEFAKDSLFCEWAYVIDLDKKTLEVYQGFNTEPLDYFDGSFIENDVTTPKRYYPIKLVKSYSLNKLPSESKFLKDLEKEE
jgi:hypothetical protein